MIDYGRPWDINTPGTPPHLSREDYPLYERYLPLVRAAMRRTWFDVALGPEQPTTPDTPPPIHAMWTRLNRKRLDVLWDSETHWHIVELRDQAQPNAIGRLLTYRALWYADPPDSRPVILELITNRDDAAVRLTCRQLSIIYYVV